MAEGKPERKTARDGLEVPATKLVRHSRAIASNAPKCINVSSPLLIRTEIVSDAVYLPELKAFMQRRLPLAKEPLFYP